ncbi:hypothetical protein SEA_VALENTINIPUFF_111 [Microbacterium phage ValentiniPuff]|uniref:Uncharacterized protein n=1 Tax=Microbacterium phage ValentiniPuff TaxID=2315705 RepID=A0A386KQX9_9CAUD|nr:hypothetical protein SEA_VALENTINIPUFF_111 [Microbacterium phage ValentiniPuff]
MPEEAINPLATYRFTGFKPWMGVPVSIAIGPPRWMPGIDKIRALAPYGVKDIPDDDDFRVAYAARLDEHEDEIQRELLRLSKKWPGQRLVLMCWEDLTKPDVEMCHRTEAAIWLRKRGLTIEEIDVSDAPPSAAPRRTLPNGRLAPPPAPPAPEEPTLF